jgi:two-component system response regulator FlrC
MSKFTVLIVEDDKELREALGTTLELAGFKDIQADCAETAISLLGRQSVDLVVSDVNMPGMDGHGLLDYISANFPALPVTLITAYGQISQAVSAIQKGAADYIVKPFEPNVLIESVSRILGTKDQSTAPAEQPVAEDPYSRKLFQLAQKVAQTDSTIMISGESGTGKEVVARYIHDCSPRRNEPFIAINCAAIPENMLEAILFGHEKGAFTGAYNSAPGKFEQANGGTILLDEVSEMDMGLQAKLLRVLQEREVERVGGRKTISLDVRVLATTNRDLKEYVAENKFREDLYYRLSVFPLQWKPLRERPLDVLPLAERLLSIHCKKMKRPVVMLDDSAKQQLMNYPWPGNVRELDNAMQRALILQQGQWIKGSDLCLEVSTAQDWLMQHDSSAPLVHGAGVEEMALPAQSSSLDGMSASNDNVLGADLRKREFMVILETLRKERGRKKQAAESLGISPRTLRYKMARMRDYGINIEKEMAMMAS